MQTQLTDVTSVAANATVDNAFDGKTGEYLTAPAVVALAVVAAAAGLNVTFMIGDKVIIDDEEASDANRWPIDPDDYGATGAGLPGDRIICRLRNTTGAAINTRSVAKVQPI